MRSEELFQTRGRDSIELFAGAGGLGVGLANAGFRPRLVVERDRWCCDTLRENHGVVSDWRMEKHKHWHIVEDDIRRIDFASYQGLVDLVSGGPPCQPFSLGGRHRASEDGRDMFPEAVRTIRETAPKAFIFENVKGLTRSTFSDYFMYVQLQLQHPELLRRTEEAWSEHYQRLRQHHASRDWDGLNYNVVTKTLNAADYGVPQRRERVIFVGFRGDMNSIWSFGDGNYSQESLVWDQMFGNYWDRHSVPTSHRKLEGRAKVISRRLSVDEKPPARPWLTTRDAIGDLPDPMLESESDSFADHRFQPGARSYPGHTGSYLDEPSKTLKAGVHGVPGGENMLRRADGYVRYFTVRESARIQTFPDEYRFHGSWSECMRQLGNAVPARLAQVIGESVRSHLDACVLN